MRALAAQDRPVWSQMSFAAAADNFAAGTRLGLEAEVVASDIASVDALAADAQVILTSGELVDRIGRTFAEVVIIDNYLDQAEITAKIERALG